MNSNPYSQRNLLAELFPPDDPIEEVEAPEEPTVQAAPEKAPPSAAKTIVKPKHPAAASKAKPPARAPRAKTMPVSKPAAADDKPSSEGPGADAPARAPWQERGTYRALGQIVAVVNQKGGVGKTTSTINLGAALAEHGSRILLVDFDPQGALSVGLGLNPNEIEVSVYDLLLDRTVGLKDVTWPSKVPGLDLVPSNIDLSVAEVVLVSEVAREQMLKRCLEPAQAIYDYILIDCPPSLGLLTVNALTAADSVIIPLECEYFALRGMALLMDTVGKVQERLNPGLQVMGIVATMLEARTIHGREVLSRVGEAFGDKLFKTVIHKTIKFSEGSVAGVPILAYAPSSNGAQEYRDLAREVVGRAS
ncbi:ParA family protein [soil metagenome]